MVPQTALTNEELAVALLNAAGPYSPHSIRCRAAILGAIGNDPTMVRKFEAKPIRAFRTTATQDMENCEGDCFLTDREMDKALNFSGYDNRFRTIEGRHVAGYTENYREAMAYLWKDWPQRVKAVPSAPRAQEVILADKGWQLLAKGFKSTRGSSCNAKGEVFFADTTADKIHRINLDGTVSKFAANTGKAHCVSVGANGALYTISEKSGKLMSYDAGGMPKVVPEDILGHSILAMPDHGLYVTTNAGKPREGGTVWFIKDGKKKQVDSGLTFATGMAYRPDQWLLSVADGPSKWAYSYRINADGALAHKERFFLLHVNDWQDDAGADHSSRAGQRPRDRRGHRRKRHGHAFRPLRQQDLETQDPAARQGRVEPVDAGDRHETVNRCTPPAVPST